MRNSEDSRRTTSMTGVAISAALAAAALATACEGPEVDEVEPEPAALAELEIEPGTVTCVPAIGEAAAKASSSAAMDDDALHPCPPGYDLVSIDEMDGIDAPVNEHGEGIASVPATAASAASNRSRIRTQDEPPPVADSATPEPAALATCIHVTELRQPVIGLPSWYVLVPSRNRSFNCILANGNAGGPVRRLQQHLNLCYERIAVDGIYGAQTATAVRNVQRRLNIPVDGIYGPQTSANMQMAWRHIADGTFAICARRNWTP